jgi:hypothetical protein
MRNIKRVVLQYKDSLMDKDNVVGVGIGYKIKQGKETDTPAVMVFVEKKLPKKELDKKQIIPETLGETVTDVLEVGEIRFLSERTKKTRPAQPGMSIGHYKTSAGTFGAVVRDASTKEPLILSNNHVLANVSNGRDNRARIGDPILQPGPYDGGNQNDVIGHLYRFVPINLEGQATYCPIAMSMEMLLNGFLMLIKPNYRFKIEKYSFENTVDAALAKPVSPDVIIPEIMGLGRVKGIKEAKPGVEVQKSGRTSGITRGKVRAVDSFVKVVMGEDKKAVFKDQIVSEPLAKPGDSGSLVLDMENNAIGLLFAGSDRSTILNPIKLVINKLNVEL